MLGLSILQTAICELKYTQVAEDKNTPVLVPIMSVAVIVRTLPAENGGMS